MTRRSDPMAELGASMAFSAEDRAAFLASMQARIVAVFTAEHEPVPELDPLLDQLVAAFATGRARRIRSALQGALIQTAVAELSVPTGLRDLVAMAAAQFDAAAVRIDGLMRTIQAADPTQVGAEVEAHLLANPLGTMATIQLVRAAIAAKVGRRSAASAENRYAAAKKALWDEWEKHQAECAAKHGARALRNFSDEHVTWLKEKFPNGRKGEALTVTADTIYRWLLAARKASSPNGTSKPDSKSG